MEEKIKENYPIIKNKSVKYDYIKLRIFKLYLFFLIFILIFIYRENTSLSFFNNYKKNFFSLNNFTSYSQSYEDLILYCIFYDIENGFYIDIGANDPNIISVTKSFYLSGWYGINIEPLKDKFIELTNYRRRDINLNIGVGSREENLTLYVQGTCSTLSKNYSYSNKSYIIPIYKMSNICKKYVPKSEIIQFCKIDVEGSEKNVLLGFDFKNYRPKVFCIESTYPATNIPCYQEWEDILLKNE